MHFGDFNPLEVLANAAVQRGVDNAAANEASSTTSTSDVTKASTSSSSDDANAEKADVAKKQHLTTESSNLSPLTVVTTPNPSTSPVAKQSQNAAPYVVKMVAPNKTPGQAPVMSLKDATKIVIPNKDGSSKTLTVLKINKGAKPGQSIQYVIDRKTDEDEGYCSRSSLDSPGQCTRSDSCERDSDMRSPNIASKKIVNTSVFSPQSPPMKTEGGSTKSPVKAAIQNDVKKPAKIVIVSRDSVNSKTFVSKLDNCNRAKTEVTSPNATVLRTLLGAKKESDANVVLKNDMDLTPVAKSCDGSHLSGSDSQGSQTQQTVLVGVAPDQDTSAKATSTSQNLQQPIAQQSIPTKQQHDTTLKHLDKACDNQQTVSKNVRKEKLPDSPLTHQQNVFGKSHSVSTVVTHEKSVAMKSEISQIADANAAVKSMSKNDSVVTNVTKASKVSISANQASSQVSENKDTVQNEQDLDNTQSTMRKRKGSFQNAFKSFIGTEKPVEVRSDTVSGLRTERASAVISTNLLSALKNQGHVTVIKDSAASAEIKTKITDVKQTEKSATKSGATVHSATLHKEEEEIIDVMSVDETSLPVKDGSLLGQPTGEKGTVTLPTPLNTTPLQVAINQSVIGSTTNGKANALAKTIPVLINTTNGKRLANVPVSSLLSASSAQSQKSVTYLVMPPQNKATSLLVPQQIAKPQMLGVPKYQYIIQDDVPPMAKTNPLVAHVQDVNANSALVQKGNEAWTLLATVNQQHVSPGTSKAAKTVPLLIKSPLINQTVAASNTTALLQNSVVLSSRAPQSLIPKFVTSAAAAQCSSQALQQSRSLGGAKQSVPIINTVGSKGHVILGTATDNVLQPDTQQSSHSSLQTLNENSNASSLLSGYSSNTESGPNLGEKIVLSSIGSVSGGRNTPVTGRITPLHSLETSPSENTINIKITGSKVTRTSDEPRPRKASTSIGKFGALSGSWTDFSAVPTGSRSEMNSPIAFGSSTASPTSSMEPWSPASLHIKSDSELDVSMDSIVKPSTTSRVANSKRKNRSASVGGVDLTAIKSGAVNVGRLHPLIDHDYCSFKQFIAEIQSSIIATTESKQKIEKYNQKAKAARTKDSLFKIDKSAKYKKRKYNHRSPLENIRKIRHDKLVDRTDISLPKSDSLSPLCIEQRAIKPLSSKGLRTTSRRHSQAALERKSVGKMRHLPRRGDGKNYVKITGSYQDDFVYYATKHSRGRPRKYHDATTPETFAAPKPVKKPAVGGINVFDWYRDLSQTDKSSRFGIPESPSAVSLPETTGSSRSEVKGALPKDGQTPLHESEVADLVISMLPQEDFGADNTPVSLCHSEPSVTGLQTETIVTNEVNNELHGMTEIAPGDVTQQEEIDHVLNRLLNTMDESYLNKITEKLKSDFTPAQSEEISTVPMDFTPAQSEEISTVPTETIPDSPVVSEVNLENKAPSLESNDTITEDEVKPEIKEEKVEVTTEKETEIASENQQTTEEVKCEVKEEPKDEETESPMKDDPGPTDTPSKMLPSIEPSDLSAFLGPYSQTQNLSQTSTTFDLDDINDDLLPSDIGNMNALIGDLARSSGSVVSASLESRYTTASLTPMDSPAKTPLPEDFHFNNSLVKGELPGEASTFMPTPALDHSEPSTSNATFITQTLDEVKPTTSGLSLGPGLQSVCKLDQNELFGDVTRVSATPSPVQRPPEMIVVSMFWNDLPGLMIEGKRCVRLVDIHKQMLPAKDTGILKKRCQMMGLEVLNCNEMERDFLIRYANAAKSKSCVVVSKDDAEALINFYVNPRPRVVPRPSSSSGSRESSAERVLENSRLTNSGASTPSTESDFEYEPPKPAGGKGKGKGKGRPQQSCARATTPAGGGGKAQKRKQSPLAAPPPPPTHAPVSHEGAVTQTAASTASTPLPTTVDGASPNDAIKRSNRARAKVNYAALNAGLGPNNDGDENELPDETTEESLFPEGSTGGNSDRTNVRQSPGSVRPGVLRQNGINGRGPNKMLDSDKYSFPEESEIRRLRNKQKRKGLNNSERRKLRRLKDRLKLKVKKLKKKLDRLKKTNGSQLVTSKNFLVKKALNNVSRVNTINTPVKSILLPGLKMRLQKEKVEQLNKTVPLTQVSSESLPQEPVVVKTKLDTKHVELVVPPSPVKPTVVEEMAAENSNPSPSNEPARPAEVVTPRSTRRLSERENNPIAEAVASRPARRPSERRASMKLLSATTPTTPTLKSKTKIHLPVLHRSNQRGRTQTGTLHVNLYRTRESACVQCETCSDFLSVRKFLKHLHHQNNVDELCMVTLPQKMELALLEPLPEQLKIWQQFEVKRDTLDRTFEENKANVSRAKAAAMVARRASSASTSGSKQQQTPRQSAKVHKRRETSPAQAQLPLTPAAPSPSVVQHSESTPPSADYDHDGSGTRQSTRVRKRKQLHPMESYVYSYTSPPPEADGSAAKRRRLSSEKGFKVDTEEIVPPSVVACSNHILLGDKSDVCTLEDMSSNQIT